MLRSIPRVALSISLALLTVALAASPAAAQVPLRWKFNAGDKLQYTLTQKVTNVGTTNGMDITTTTDVIMDLYWDVKAVDASGTADMTQTIDRIRFKMTAPLTEVDFDSQAPAKPDQVVTAALTSLLGGIVKAPFSLKVTPQGEAKDFKAPEQVTKLFKNSAVAGNLGPLFAPQGLEQMLTEALVPFPAEAVAKGHTWQRKLESKTQTIENSYTAAGVEVLDGKTLEKIEIKTKLSLPAGSKVTLKDQKADGAILFDPAAGRIVSSAVDQSATMEILVGDAKTTSKVSSNSVFKLVSEKPATKAAE